MKIDLLDLAKKAELLHREVELSFDTIKVYHVPDIMVLGARSLHPEPVQPMIRMETVTGFQDRLSKPGDPEYEKWQFELNDYNENIITMRTATRMVLALRDIKFSDVDISAPTLCSGPAPIRHRRARRICRGLRSRAR